MLESAWSLSKKSAVLQHNHARPAPRHAADVIVGVQWGDEGKGRVVDYYAERYDIIARFGGGDNAGHTIVVGDRKVALRIVPSGVFQEKTLLFVGGGSVVRLSTLADELSMLEQRGVDVARIKISDRAHVVFPYHGAVERSSEERRGAHAIGTTGRGIGPAYVDKAARLGITFGDLRRPDALAQKLRSNAALHDASSQQRSDADTLIAETLTLGRRLLPHVVDGVEFLHGAMERGRKVLIEGAQGTMLDVGYGTYPFVTSSHTIAGGACTGLGIGPRDIGAVIGVAKAYCTRVGGGPFPSEVLGSDGDLLRERGGEFGTVTGRPRRCGWFDAVAARYASRLNGLTSAVITKLDVLTGFERIGVVVAYENGGAAVSLEGLAERPVETRVEWYDGWDAPLDGIRTIGNLPAAARRYVEMLQSALGVPIESVSVGPERAELAVAER